MYHHANSKALLGASKACIVSSSYTPLGLRFHSDLSLENSLPTWFLKFQSEAVLGKWSDPKKDSLDQGIGNSAQNNCNSNSNSGQKIYWILQYAIFDPLKTTAIMQYLLICQIIWFSFV